MVHFERHSVRTGSFQTGVVVLAAKHRSARAGLPYSETLACSPVLSHLICCQTFRCFLQILKRNESLSNKAGDPPSSAILVVYLDKAEELPVSHISPPSVPKFVLSSVLHSVSVVYLRHSFKFHLSGTPQNCCLSRNNVEVNTFPTLLIYHTQNGSLDRNCGLLFSFDTY